jgi:hypothetical protein
MPHRLTAERCSTAYFKSNFETDNPGWMFWENFREDRAQVIALVTGSIL